MKHGTAALLLAKLVLVSVDTAAAQRNFVRQAAAPGRDWRTWPFSRRSPWNYPIGSAATYAPVQRLSSYPIGFNYDGRWTAAVAIATPEDSPMTMMFSPNWGHTSSWAFLDRGNRNCGNSARRAVPALLRATPPPTIANYYRPARRRTTTSGSRELRPADETGGQFLMPPGACPRRIRTGCLRSSSRTAAIDIYAGVVLSSGEVVGMMASG
jgi:hypothetical protein